MKKTLLGAATASCFGAAAAYAQLEPNPSQGQYVGRYGSGPALSNNNNAWGIANTPSGSKDAGQLSTIYAPNVVAVPKPGTVVIRLNARVEADLTATFTDLDSGVSSSGAPTGYKLNPLAVTSHLRLYPGFDGVSSNGLRYGAAAEIRQNFPAGTAPASSPSTNSSGQTLYVRRAFAYLADDRVGLLRLGQGDGVLGLFDNCIFSSNCWDAGIGGLNGSSGYPAVAPSGAVMTYVWLTGSGAEYTNAKAVYLSPQFYGFDFGVQYAPNMGNGFQNSGSCGQASADCTALTSGNDATRWINQVAVGVRYQQLFGSVDVKAYGFYETAGRENLTTSAYLTPGAARSTGANAYELPYDNLSFYKFGVAVTAMNFTFAADYIGGAVNGQLQMRPAGGAPMNALVTGLTYANGPLTAGVQFGVANSQGAAQLTGLTQRHEVGVAVGGSYRLAPGLQIVTEYQYAYRHQGGFNFATNSLGAGTTATTAGYTKDAQGQGITIATVLTW